MSRLCWIRRASFRLFRCSVMRYAFLTLELKFEGIAGYFDVFILQRRQSKGSIEFFVFLVSHPDIGLLHYKHGQCQHLFVREARFF